MRFSDSGRLDLPCRLVRLVEGQPHPDGRRYLPLLIFELDRPAPGGVAQIAVVDRHHRADPAHVGRRGSARLVFLLSAIALLDAPRAGLFDAAGDGRASSMPEACGQVVAVPTWETERTHLPYESLYTELVLDIGSGTIGVRTSATAASLAEMIGAPEVHPGDWLRVTRSRVDLLAFAPGGAP